MALRAIGFPLSQLEVELLIQVIRLVDKDKNSITLADFMTLKMVIQTMYEK